MKTSCLTNTAKGGILCLPKQHGTTTILNADYDGQEDTPPPEG